MEAVHEDYLERCVNTGSKREYKKSYFVFRRDATGSKTLEFYKDANWKKNEPRGVCNLFNGYVARSLCSNESKKKFGIELKTVGKTFEFYAASEQGRDKWLHVLNEDLENFHSAVLLDSPDSAYSFVRVLTGQLHLQVTDCSVILLSNRTPSITWRFGTIRRYKSKDGAFVLEVGRKAATGEGVFRFQVPDPNKLFDDLDKALKQRIQIKRNQDGSAESRRTSSFDEQLNKRKSATIRAPSMEERTFSPPEYSSLDNIPVNKAACNVPQATGYDKLFGDHSQNVTRPSPPILFNSTSKIGGSSKRSDGTEGNAEDYIDMSGMKDEIIKEQKSNKKCPDIKPRPVPRSAKPLNDSSDDSVHFASPIQVEINSGTRIPSTSEVDLIDLNTYDCPSTTNLSNSTDNRNHSDYHVLNNSNRMTPKSDDVNPGYDHLSHIHANNKSSETLSNNEDDTRQRSSTEDTYDCPRLSVIDIKTSGSHQLYSNGDSAKRPPPIIARPAVRRPLRSDRVSSCETLPNTLLVLGKASTQSNSAASDFSESLYDSPRGNFSTEFSDGGKEHSLSIDALRHMNEGSNGVYQVPRVDF